MDGRRIIIAALALVLLGVRGAHSDVVVVLHTGQSPIDGTTDNRGWWSTGGLFGENSDPNINYAVGNIAFVGRSRAFFSFNTSLLPDGLVGLQSAHLSMRRYESGGGNRATEYLGFFDVSTNVITLNNTVGSNAAIYDDLGSGVHYGTATVAGTGNPLDVFDLSLNAAAIADIEAAAATSSWFSVGAALYGLGTNPYANIYLFGLSSSPLPAPSLTLTFADQYICGNGRLSGVEECDDGGTVPGDGCSGTCQIEPGWECQAEPSVCLPPVCGDGVVEFPEACDDAGTLPGNGCDANCQVETGWECGSEPSSCSVRQTPAIEWVTVGSPGNEGDRDVATDGTTDWGWVPVEYRIGKFEVTNKQYAEFLNAVAVDDINGLYDVENVSIPEQGGIARSGSSGSYAYTVIAGREDRAASHLSFWSAARYANWLHNGQPVGPQNSATTEDGAYTLTAAGIASNSVVRNPGATVFIPSEDEWYKAAYYDPVLGTYYDNPIASDAEVDCTAPGMTPNTANCFGSVGAYTDVGSYTGAPSPSGTFDQGGNVSEWNESIIVHSSSYRGQRGGYFYSHPSILSASNRSFGRPPDTGGVSMGLRFARPALSAETIDWIAVDSPGNVCDSQGNGCFGTVTERFRISKLEVNNAQYAKLLNSVAATDPNGLYNPKMGSIVLLGGISRFGISGTYRYSAIAGREDRPVTHVSFWDALRFANWLHNGQPVGPQDSTTTEDGAYTLTAAGIANNTVTRNTEAEVFLPSEDEWYKAAYYNPDTDDYYDYPAGSDIQTTCALPGATPNEANCANAVAGITSVGSYPGSPSPLGTFDQGGNVWEWNDAVTASLDRGIRGGGFDAPSISLAASDRSGSRAEGEFDDVGFRVATLESGPGPIGKLSINWLPIDAPGNACDSQIDGCFGSVTAPYSTAMFEVSNSQYATFLNAVAATDTNELYDTAMGSNPGVGGISRFGISGTYRYSTIAGREDRPVTHVSFWDALRFANWLHNGQPVGPQDSTTTEDGAYTLTAAGIANNTVTRNTEAEVFLPSEDEWYKAAYYNPDTNDYYDYPAGSDIQTTCALPGATPNGANCANVVADITSVGSYPGSPSPLGTFDQGGNVWEWNETVTSYMQRGIRGGGTTSSASFLEGAFRTNSFPAYGSSGTGFRVATSVPEPGLGAGLIAGLLLLLSLSRHRRQVRALVCE